MRIAMISPLEMRVPPTAYGGIELVVSLLTEELVDRGHKVTLFASGDSLTKAELQSICPHSLRGSHRDKGILNMLNVVSCLEQADRFDIIHNHTLFEGLATASLVRTPMLTTFHGPLQGDWLVLFAAYKGYYNTISRAMKALLPPKKGFVGTIYNAIDCKAYPLGPERREGYLLFLSRICGEKGTHLAIAVARQLGRRLVIAGNIDEEEYFQAKILPEVDGDLVQYVGEANFEEKKKLYCHADCLLMPITWPEPFGLVMVEAMACGTPVIAFNRGAAPELVIQGKTGFLVNNLREMVEAVGEVHRIDRRSCREHVERHFDVPRMVDNYLLAYERILETGRSRIPLDLTGPIPRLEQTIAIPGNPEGATTISQN